MMDELKKEDEEEDEDEDEDEDNGTKITKRADEECRLGGLGMECMQSTWSEGSVERRQMLSRCSVHLLWWRQQRWVGRRWVMGIEVRVCCMGMQVTTEALCRISLYLPLRSRSRYLVSDDRGIPV